MSRELNILKYFVFWLLCFIIICIIGITNVFAAENETFWSKTLLGRFANDNWVQIAEKTSTTDTLQLTGISEYDYYPYWIGFYGNKSTNFEPNKIYNLSFRINYSTSSLFKWKEAMQYANIEIYVQGSTVSYCTLNINNMNYSEWTCQFTVSSSSSYYEINANWYGTDLSDKNLGFLLDSYNQSITTSLILTSNVDNSGQIVSQNEIIIGQNQQIIDNQREQNETSKGILGKIKELFNFFSNDDPIDASAVSDVAGWLPAGPLDSLINLPLTFFNSLSSDLSQTCSPIELPLPYVNDTLTLPCINTLYNEIGINDFLDWIGVIASCFILYSYLMKLYKWVDDTLDLRAKNALDGWGGV